MTARFSVLGYHFSAAVCLYFLFLHGLDKRDLWNSHEARAAMNARAVLDGDWLLPHLHDGSPELQKPPLYYWLSALTASLTGEVDAWSVRLPAALAAILCVGVVVALGWGMGRVREGIVAAVLLATAAHFTWLARVARIDMPLTLTTTVALMCFYLSSTRRLFLLGAYVALALAILLKGPIGLVLVAAALGLFLLLEGRLPAPWQLRRWGCILHEYGIWWGAPLMLAIVLPWFLAVDSATDGEWTRVFFWYHNVERGLGGAQLRAHPWWTYGPRFFADFAPWSALLPICLVWFFRNGRWREDRDARFGLAWFVGMTLVLSLARYKRADYLVPAYPGAALFLGCVIVRWGRGLSLRFARPVNQFVFTGVLVVAAFIWWFRVEFILPRSEPMLEQRTFAALIRKYAPAPETVLLFQTEAHILTFHLGKPVHLVRQWEELDALIGDGVAHLVLPLEFADEWPQHLHRVNLDEIARHPAGHEKPVVLYRARRKVCTTRQDAR
jgi:4-amino-4-deoxy-L-arabinose transferase-like glycosyltransferase